MYCEYFGFNKRPFDDRWKPEFFIADAGISRDLVRLGLSLTSGSSVVAVTGSPGIGKSAIVEEALRPLADKIVVARADARYADHDELFALVLTEFGIPVAGQEPICLRDLRDFTRQSHESGRQPIVSLDAPVLATAMAKKVLRLALAGGEPEHPLNIVLQGPERLQMLFNVPGLLHLRQRMRFRYRVQALDAEQTRRYVGHHLNLAGGNMDELLDQGVSEKIHQYSNGVPRLINTLVDAALTEVFATDTKKITLSVLDVIARDLGWDKPAAPTSGRNISNRDNRISRFPSKPARTSSRPANPNVGRDAAPVAKVSTARPSAATKPASRNTANVSATAQPAHSLQLEEDTTTSRAPETTSERASPTENKTEDSSIARKMGRMRLEDLDDQLAETFFTNDPEILKQFRKTDCE